MKFTPRPDQQRAIDFLLQTPYAALWARMGSGKTAVTLYVIDALLRRYDVSNVLIVAPKRVALDVWPAEMAKWGFDWWVTPPQWVYDVTLPVTQLNQELNKATEKNAELALQGAPQIDTEPLKKALRTARKNALEMQPATVTIIGVDMLPKLADTFQKKWPFDMVVLDEASLFKNGSSVRNKCVRALRRYGLVSRLVELTGTPAGNGLIDVHGQIRLLDELALGTLTQFKDRWFDSDYMGYSLSPRKGAAEGITDAIKHVTLVLDARNTAEPPMVNDVVVRPDLRLYRKFAREAMLAEQEITAVNAAVLVGKLVQAASGYVYNDTGAPVELHRAKYDALADMIEEQAGDPLLVVYQFKSELAELRKMGIPELRDRPDMVSRWNAGRLPVMALHPKSGGHGLNLQDGGATMVWFSPVWSLELYQQVVARLDRSGQTRRVIVHRLVSHDTIDRDVYDVLSGKAESQESLITRLKKKIDNSAHEC